MAENAVTFSCSERHKWKSNNKLGSGAARSAPQRFALLCFSLDFFCLSDCFRQESSTLDECAGQKGGWVGKQPGLVSHRVGLMERHSFEQQTGICEL